MSGSRHFIARARRKSGQVAWRLALGSVSGALPERYVRSIVEQAWRSELAAHLDEVVVLSGAHVEEYDFGGPLPPQFRASKAFDARHLYRLRNVCVSPRTGLSWLPGGPVLGESFGSLQRMLGWDNGVLQEPLVRPRTTVEGPGRRPCRPFHFHHALLESLPCALHALAAEPDATLVVSRTLPRFAREAIELLGIREVRWIDEPIVAESFVLVAHEPAFGFVPPEDVEAVRRALLPGVGPPAGPADGIYVSRRLATRAPANEPELEKLAVAHGFKVVNAESLPFAEQVALFSAASRIAGAHGAGLANLVFADEPVHLVEIFVVDKFNDCYARLAASRGGVYQPIFCTGAEMASSVAPLDSIESAFRGH